MNPIRRACLRSGAAMAAASSMPWLGGCAGFGPGDLPGAIAYRPKSVRATRVHDGALRATIGTARVTAVADGFTTIPLDADFVRNAALQQVREALADAQLGDGRSIPVPYTAFVVDFGGRRMLLDAGSGPRGAPGTGRLLANLRSASIDPASIEAVLISHFHGDHIHGLLGADGRASFPEARVFVPAPEWNWWMDDARMRAAPAALRGGFESVRRVFDPIAARVQRFEPGGEVFAGIDSIPAFGHTPGHTGYGFDSGGHRFAYVADLAHVAALFLRHPDWAVRFDGDAEAARASRRRILDQAVAGRWVVAGFHWPGAAMGRIARRGDGYSFSPLVG